MKIIKRINHNAAICLDSQGRETIALGTGVGFPDGGDDLDISRVERTFYGVDERYLAILDEIPFDVVEFSAQLADVIQGMLSYALSPGYPLVLADHIAFMLKRFREHVPVTMPLSYDIKRMYPLEWSLGVFVVDRARKYFNVPFKDAEVAGIALGILGSADAGTGDDAPADVAGDFLDEVTAKVEERFGIAIDRDGVDYARFATHVLCLARSARPSTISPEQSSQWLVSLEESVPDIVSSAYEIASLFETRIGWSLGTEEIVYLGIHINRLCNASGWSPVSSGEDS